MGENNPLIGTISPVSPWLMSVTSPLFSDVEWNVGLWVKTILKQVDPTPLLLNLKSCI